jgi:hypothetical protein
VAGVATVALALGARIAGVGGFEPYPAIDLDTGLATLGLALALPLLAAAPFALARPRRARRRAPRPVGPEAARA